MYKGDAAFKHLIKYDFNLYRGNKSVAEFLIQYFNQYVSDLAKVSDGENPLLGEEFTSNLRRYLPEIQRICREIVEISETYRAGKIKDAYEKAYCLFTTMRPYYSTKPYDEESPQYYRLRQGDLRIKDATENEAKKAAMFHIADYNRHLIGAYRYSIQGFPCLYLASDFELAWFESGMPNQVSYCQMQIDVVGEESLNLIDFSNHPINILSTIEISLRNAQQNNDTVSKILNYFMNYLMVYPLAAACSMKVQNRGDRFVEEYVIPQLFMQWIRDNEFYSGVRYKSSLNTELVKHFSAVNIALPVKKFRGDGLCETLTSKISISDIGFLNVNDEFKKYQKKLIQLEEFKHKLWVEVKEVLYWKDASKIIEICEEIYLVYTSIINGTQLNELILTQINNLSSHIETIYENKHAIIKTAIEKAPENRIRMNEEEFEETLKNVIHNFYKLASEIVTPNVVFYFSKRVFDRETFEKI